jgi:hypothetical protein
MTIIDKQRIAAIKKLEQLGYTFAGDDWIHPANDPAAIAPTITDELLSEAHRQGLRRRGLANSAKQTCVRKEPERWSQRARSTGGA